MKPWPPPDPGDIVWCLFPEFGRRGTPPGPKPRPALVMEVSERADGTNVVVAYGTSQKLDRLYAGEFAIRRADHAAAFALSGLAYDTKFDVRRTLALPWTARYFAPAPVIRFGQFPKLGVLHVSVLKLVAKAVKK